MCGILGVVASALPRMTPCNRSSGGWAGGNTTAARTGGASGSEMAWASATTASRYSIRFMVASPWRPKTDESKWYSTVRSTTSEPFGQS